jgi:hypothetical protein
MKYFRSLTSPALSTIRSALIDIFIHPIQAVLYNITSSLRSTCKVSTPHLKSERLGKRPSAET